MIPTTAGSGAEVTSNAVIFIKNSKFSFENSNLIPDNFFILSIHSISNLGLINCILKNK